MPGNAPVESVGGTQDRGPWPTDVSEIVAGESYRRLVVTDDGQEVEKDVTVISVEEIERDDGTETDGYVVTFQHGGGA